MNHNELVQEINNIGDSLRAKYGGEPGFDVTADDTGIRIDSASIDCLEGTFIQIERTGVDGTYLLVSFDYGKMGIIGRNGYHSDFILAEDLLQLLRDFKATWDGEDMRGTVQLV